MIDIVLVGGELDGRRVPPGRIADGWRPGSDVRFIVPALTPIPPIYRVGMGGVHLRAVSYRLQEIHLRDGDRNFSAFVGIPSELAGGTNRPDILDLMPKLLAGYGRLLPGSTREP